MLATIRYIQSNWCGNEDLHLSLEEYTLSMKRERNLTGIISLCPQKYIHLKTLP
jgi:hypothetical protein